MRAKTKKLNIRVIFALGSCFLNKSIVQIEDLIFDRFAFVFGKTKKVVWFLVFGLHLSLVPRGIFMSLFVFLRGKQKQ
jgi:hypothetical protein